MRGHPEPHLKRVVRFTDIAQHGGWCGMILPLVVISGSDLFRRATFGEDDRAREGGTLGQRDGKVDRSGSAGRPTLVAITRPAVPERLDVAPRRPRQFPMSTHVTSLTECAGRRPARRTED